MKNPSLILLVIVFSLVFGAAAMADDVTFDSEPINTIYGAPTGYVPGDFMFSEFGAQLYVSNF